MRVEIVDICESFLRRKVVGLAGRDNTRSSAADGSLPAVRGEELRSRLDDRDQRQNGEADNGEESARLEETGAVRRAAAFRMAPKPVPTLA
jgi:hypothetical protein